MPALIRQGTVRWSRSVCQPSYARALWRGQGQYASLIRQGTVRQEVYKVIMTDIIWTSWYLSRLICQGTVRHHVDKVRALDLSSISSHYYPDIYLSIHQLSTLPSIHLSNQLTIRPSIQTTVGPFNRPSIHPSTVHSSFHPSIQPINLPPTHPTNRRSVQPSLYPSTNCSLFLPSIHPSN